MPERMLSFSVITDTLFARELKSLREKKGIAQAELANLLVVDRSTITRWENGSRIPNHAMMARIAKALNVDISLLLNTLTEKDETLNVILVDDTKIILKGSIPILEDVFPNAEVTGFTLPSEALDYAKKNRIGLAFLDIEMGRNSGLDLCRALLEINSHTNVVFLTAYVDYAFDAWATGACGFLLKPLTHQAVRDQLEKLRYPLWAGAAGE